MPSRVPAAAVPDGLESLLTQRRLDDLVHAAVGALDLRDWTAYGRCFAPDVVFALPQHASSSSDTPESVTGVERFIPILRSVLDGFDAVAHHITNMVHHVGSDEASTSCYVVAEHVLGDVPGENTMSIGGRYAIEARRTGEEWSLTRWDFTPAWTRGNLALFALAAERTTGKSHSG